jgi:hypothetical protein
MRRAIPVVILVAGLAVVPSAAWAGGLDLRLGAFLPAANSNLFDDDQSLYFVQKSDFNGFTGGAEYNVEIARSVELGFDVNGYGRTIDTSYRDYTRPDGSEIYQTLHLEIVPFGVSIRLVPTGRRTKIAPYLAAGPDLFYWKYEEYGDLIDFVDPTFPIYSDHFVSDGVAFGGHVAAGLRYYVNRDFAVVVEGRYQYAKADMGGDFAPNEAGLVNRIDLSGTSVTVGLHVRF